MKFDRVPVRKKLFLKNYKSNFKSDKCFWDIIPWANLCPKVFFGLWPFSWLNLVIFYFDGHFYPSNGRHTCHNLAQSCPHWWRRLSSIKIQCGMKNDWCGMKSVRHLLGHNYLPPSFRFSSLKNTLMTFYRYPCSIFTFIYGNHISKKSEESQSKLQITKDDTKYSVI